MVRQELEVNRSMVISQVYKFAELKWLLQIPRQLIGR
jgi:hypothetical protein